MKKLKLFLFATIATIAMLATSCSKSDDKPSSSCNDIVCGGISGGSTYTIFRGTLKPDTCGKTELIVNKATFDYYKAKWDLNPEGYACWDGLK